MVFSPGARRCCKKGETREGRNKLRTSLLYCSGKFKQSKYSSGNFSMYFFCRTPLHSLTHSGVSGGTKRKNFFCCFPYALLLYKTNWCQVSTEKNPGHITLQLYPLNYYRCLLLYFLLAVSLNRCKIYVHFKRGSCFYKLLLPSVLSHFG